MKTIIPVPGVLYLVYTRADIQYLLEHDPQPVGCPDCVFFQRPVSQRVSERWAALRAQSKSIYSNHAVQPFIRLSAPETEREKRSLWSMHVELEEEPSPATFLEAMAGRSLSEWLAGHPGDWKRVEDHLSLVSPAALETCLLVGQMLVNHPDAFWAHYSRMYHPAVLEQLAEIAPEPVSYYRGIHYRVGSLGLIARIDGKAAIPDMRHVRNWRGEGY